MFAPPAWPTSVAPLRAPWWAVGCNLGFRAQPQPQFCEQLGVRGGRHLACEDLETTMRAQMAGLGAVIAPFAVDVCSRRIVGWRSASHMRTDLVLDSLEMAIWVRNERMEDLIHHSDRGSQYTSIRYTERLVDAGARSSVGSTGDSYDNALAESIIGLYKTELVHRHGPWDDGYHLELATLEWVDWYNHRRLHSACGDRPPSEYEENFYRELQADTLVTGPQSP